MRSKIFQQVSGGVAPVEFGIVQSRPLATIGTGIVFGRHVNAPANQKANDGVTALAGSKKEGAGAKILRGTDVNSRVVQMSEQLDIAAAKYITISPTTKFVE